MEDKELELILSASEAIDSILFLSNLAKSALENDTIEKPWLFYPFLGVLEKLSSEALGCLRQIRS